MEIILCRHTRTSDNHNRIYSGQNDIALDAVGRKQARALASTVVRLAGPPVGAVLSSNLIRAASLAELIGEQAGVTPHLDRALREVHIGQMAGLMREDALKRFPLERHKTANPDFDYTDIGVSLRMTSADAISTSWVARSRSWEPEEFRGSWS